MVYWLLKYSITLLLVTSACGADVIDYAKGVIVDLTHPFDNTTLYYNGRNLFNLTKLWELEEKAYWVTMNRFSTVEHGGTHIDAPSHYVKDGRRVGDIALTSLIGPAVVIRAAKQAADNPIYQVTTDDILRWEVEHGTIPDRAILMLDFHWSSKWPDMTKVMGTTDPDDGKTRKYPGLHPDAARWIVKERPQINAVATEASSIDYGPSDDFATHTTLLKHNVYLLEYVANIDLVPDFATIFAIPMKIQTGTGAPLRIFAVIHSDERGSWLPDNVYIISAFYAIILIVVLIYRR